ncbi:MAG: DUF1566 domain-containing protein [Lysobacterales bacterium]
MSHSQNLLRLAAALLLASATVPGMAQDEDTQPPPKERFEVTEDGSVRDNETGLLWAARDNGGDIDWQGAQNYCQSQGGAWRLPSSAELLKIYYPSDDQMQDCIGKLTCRVTPLILLSGLTPWSSDRNGATEAFYVYFNDGQQYSYAMTNTQGKRALCVRNP